MELFALNPFQHDFQVYVSLVIGVAVWWITTIVVRKLQRYRKFPPGPWGWPLVGHAFSLGSRPDLFFVQLSEKFGKVFSLRITSRLVVVMSEPDVVREAFVQRGDSTSDRQFGPGSWFAFGADNKWSLGLSSGEPWKACKGVVVPALRSVGHSGNTIELIILDEADHLVEQFSRHENKSFDPRELATKAISNIMCSLLYGARFEYEDAIFQDIITAVHVIMWHPYSRSKGEMLLRMFPFLFYTEKAKPLREAWKTLQKRMNDTVSFQHQNLDDGNVRSLVERILVENQAQAGGGGKHRGVETRVIWRSLIDLIIAGTDTTAHTLQWALLIMALYPNVQKKVRSEIDSVIGSERNPTLSDRDNMPYTHATLLEILRHRPVAPLGLPHVVSETTSLIGYTIPKGTMLLANVWSIHHDEEFWDEPDVFKPERFLDDDLVTVKRNLPAFMPFGMGPRMCAGEFIAKLELFLVFTRLMQRFHIDFAPGEEPEELDGGVFNDTTLNPREMKLRMTLR